MNKLKKIISLFLFSSFISISNASFAFNGYEGYDYNWTNKHHVLTDYIKNNKDNILEYTPTKLERSKKYKNFIDAVMIKEGVPRELIILAAIESSFRENAVSKAKAVGMWQFTYATGKEWGLEINHKVDDRKNWKKSTIAAARYVKWMANKHFDGNYELAILSYNAGIKRVQDLMKKYNTNDPWLIIQYDDLPKESREFLPKFITFMHYYYYLQENGV